MFQPEVLLVALAFAACHLIAPWVFARVTRVRAQASSFAGGLAVAYVCLHLLPELDEGHEVLGPRVYVLVLVGLAAFYALEVWIQRGRAHARYRAAHFALHVTLSALYSFLLVFTLTFQLPATPALTVVFAASIGLHLISGDMGLQEVYGDRFVKVGRYVLVVAVALAWTASIFRRPHEVVIDIATAILAGFILFNVFKKEMPELEEARLWPFVLGGGTLFVAHVMLDVRG